MVRWSRRMWTHRPWPRWILFSRRCTVHQTFLTATTGGRLYWHCASMPFTSASASRVTLKAAAKYKTSWRNVVNSRCGGEELQIRQQRKSGSSKAHMSNVIFLLILDGRIRDSILGFFWLYIQHQPCIGFFGLSCGLSHPRRASPSTLACYVCPPKDKPPQHHWPHRTHNSGLSPGCFMMGQADHNSVWWGRWKKSSGDGKTRETQLQLQGLYERGGGGGKRRREQ